MSSKKRRLEQTITALQGRFGGHAIRRGGDAASIPALSTGFPDLDNALGTGGLPRGRITEIVGAPTSGMATLALTTVAGAQRAAGAAAWLDLPRTFDAEYAACCAVRLDDLAIVRPYRQRQALAILHDFIADGGLAALVVDLPARFLTEPRLSEALSSALSRLILPLSQSDCALLFLVSLPPGRRPSLAGYPDGVSLPHYAAVRLLIRKERWLVEREKLHGYRAQVRVVKNKFAPAEKRVSLDITLNGPHGGDAP